MTSYIAIQCVDNSEPYGDTDVYCVILGAFEHEVDALRASLNHMSITWHDAAPDEIKNVFVISNYPAVIGVRNRLRVGVDEHVRPRDAMDKYPTLATEFEPRWRSAWRYWIKHWPSRVPDEYKNI